MKYDLWLFIGFFFVIAATVVLTHAHAAVMDSGHSLTMQQMADMRAGLCE